LFERFGDLAYDHQGTLSEALWNNQSISLIRVPEIHVCDLTNAKTLSALTVDLSSLMHTNLDAPQQWGLAIQNHPAGFHGIKFRSRFNGRACLALFKRDGIEKHLKASKPCSLSHDDTAIDWLLKNKVTLF